MKKKSAAVGMPKLDEKIRRFGELILEGVKAWTEAGKLLVEILDEDPEAYERMTGGELGLTRAHLAKFEAIGRGALEPRLLLNGSAGYQRLAKAPVSAQREALDHGIRVYEETDEGETTHRLVKPNELSPLELAQVFAPGGALRTPEEQRAWLARREKLKALDEKAKETDMPDYTVRNGKVTFRAGCTLSVGQIANILQQLTKGK